MDKYAVKIYARAYRDLEGIYSYITKQLLEQKTAEQMLIELEKEIVGLEHFPERGSIRSVGAYANKGYRQLFVKNYVIIYRVVKEANEVHVVTVRYAPSISRKIRRRKQSKRTASCFFVTYEGLY